MAKDYAALTRDISTYIGELRRLQPGPMQAFSELAKSATAEGALDKKTKELIALSIGVTQRCDGCIGFHAKALKDLGATRDEIAEAMAMCVYMGGGPALMYAADALRAFDQYSEAA
ncbi:MAG: carboxymuconolactone decarboxylase family protein [Alphaproteobacteria bacterium]|jgi:AhpD family alkylhydroperoxidase|uniref:Carboxymuconolactone decarboxylase family protein n=1 Tax=Brevundimonas mediterranea TaxID=74329 RepID=A0A6G7EK79_9CAUL|nr:MULTISPECIES: carboxymuconolactone decarboxylase family protein [Brevundimonas]MBU1519972.1 carboxymuconolactone decarboxylase family protein [Alphaproteobacteria bacterium]OGN41529.1 MAG: carboxymuconolactone decarboxylase [Caulobacterales bacterium GWE1_67_11]OGN59611.1 MAG: carboxymuconolactone decarboxylase [Caulobacterales bacterium RIFOXYA1_FULL_67_7]EDX79011.1 carboxymuconolactone decarboxylase family [Brevundimonas sp. BAL3]KDP93032.1 carboxymuconolactone decarboxylase [Brevundimona